MSIDPAVRSIRIAATLNERFGAILQEAASCQKVAELELKIGEAQLIACYIRAKVPELLGNSWAL